MVNVNPALLVIFSVATTRKILGEKFEESWSYSSEKLADIVKILSESDNIAAPKLKKLIKTKPGIFQTYLSKRYFGCSQEGENSHVYSVRFGKYANRFLPETIKKLPLIRETIASGCDIKLQYKCRELPEKEIIQEIGYGFSEKTKYNIDLSNMKYQTQKLFKSIICGA